MPILTQVKNVNLDFRIKIVFNSPDAQPTYDDFKTLAYTLTGQADAKKSDVCLYKVLERSLDFYGRTAVVRVVRTFKLQTDIVEELTTFKRKISEHNRKFQHHVSAHRMPSENANIVEDKFNIIESEEKATGSLCLDTTLTMSDIQFCHGVTLKAFQLLASGQALGDNAILQKGEYVLQVSKNGKQKSVYTCLSTYASRVLGKEVEIGDPFASGLTSSACVTVSFSCVLFLIECLRIVFIFAHYIYTTSVLSPR